MDKDIDITPEQIVELYKSRASVRRFTGERIPPKVLQAVKEAGRWAATARNRQARRFSALTEREDIAELVHQADMQAFVEKTGAVIIGWAEADSPGSDADVLISMSQMEAAALAAGLGTIWLGIFDREVVASRFDKPDGWMPRVMLAMGVPAREFEPKSKLSNEELYGIRKAR